jgi:type I restriction enzyme S subunit
VIYQRLPFEDVFADESGGNIKTPQSEYLEAGRFPVVDQGKALIGGYIDDEARICGGGRPAIVFGDHTRCLKYLDIPFCMGADGVKVLRPKLEADLKYLYHYLRQVHLPGGGYDRHFKYLKRCEILIPPLPEQRRIAAILDQADALRVKRREALAQLDRLAQSVFVEMFGDPVSNPMNWPMESLTDVCHCYSGGTPSKSNPEYWQGDLPWFSAKDLKADDLFDSQDHISETVPKTTSLKLLPADTVAIVVRGMILAHTFPVSVLRVPATINQDLKALLPRKPIETQFLACCLRAQKDFILEKVSEAGHGTKRLDTLGLQEIRVPQVPDSLQKVFVARNQAIENLKNQHRTALAELDALFASLQHRAFRGEL